MRRFAGRLIAALPRAILGATVILATVALFHPETPLPDAWNPLRPLAVDHPVTPLTRWKLAQVRQDPAACLALLDTVSDVRALPPLEADGGCGIANRVSVSDIDGVRLARIETACETALISAFWVIHGLRPAARALDLELTGIDHFGSYSCRPIRTPGGDGGRMSTHATAHAIDVSGFRLQNVGPISLLRDWSGDDRAARFLRAARDSSCDWFATTLSPDYNDLHADHFHLQTRGWGLCR